MKKKRLFQKVSFGKSANQRTLLPRPRIISKEDADFLKKGTKQRGDALQAFYNDLASGEMNISKDGVIPQGIIEKILVRGPYGKKVYDRPRIGFLYGPDIVRNQSGQYQVVEDNVGGIGGAGDALQAKKDLLEIMPRYQSVLQVEEKNSYAKIIAEEAKKIGSGGETVLITYDDGSSASGYIENAYFHKQLQDHGVYVIGGKVDRGIEFTANKKGAKITFKKGSNAGKSLKVGTVIIKNLNPDWVRMDMPRTWKAMQNGAIGMIGSNHFNFLDDKELTPYVDRMIRYYLKEEPLLPTLPTESFRKIGQDGKNVFNSELFQQVKENPSQYVIKKVDEQQGKHVYIGARIGQRELNKVLRKVKRSPRLYIAQQYQPLSTVGDYLVDSRTMAFVSQKGTRVADHIWTRAVSIHGDGKVNLSQKGVVMPVFVQGEETIKSPSLPKILPEINKAGLFIGEISENTEYSEDVIGRIIANLANLHQAHALDSMMSAKKTLTPSLPFILSSTFNNSHQAAAVEKLTNFRRPVADNIKWISSPAFNNRFQVEAIATLLKSNHTVSDYIKFIAQKINNPKQIEVLNALGGDSASLQILFPKIDQIKASSKSDALISLLKLKRGLPLDLAESILNDRELYEFIETANSSESLLEFLKEKILSTQSHLDLRLRF